MALTVLTPRLCPQDEEEEIKLEINVLKKVSVRCRRRDGRVSVGAARSASVRSATLADSQLLINGVGMKRSANGDQTPPVTHAGIQTQRPVVGQTSVALRISKLSRLSCRVVFCLDKGLDNE